MIKVDYSVFIGGFRPFHNGHLKIVRKALEESDYLIMVIGSANSSQNTRIPFNAKQRKMIIEAGLPNEIKDRVIITTANDYMYNDVRWNAGIQNAVNVAIFDHQKTNPSYTNKGFKDYNSSIALVGMSKDETSYYLNLFPQWRTSIDVQAEYADDEVISSTTIRKKIFFDEIGYCKRLMPTGSYEKMLTIIETDPTFKYLFEGWAYEQRYEALYGKGPHVTVDACLIQAGHVLLIERGREYGRGLLAFPGGFLNRREKIEDGMIRELREETKIKVPEKVLRGSITERKVFDNPYRSNRSHIITHAFKIELENVAAGLPKVIGSDDAAKATWYPISTVMLQPELFFEDHFHMLDNLLN